MIKTVVQVASEKGRHAEVWDQFKTRFNIPNIREYDHSTEVGL